MKAGTSWLYRNIKCHPDVQMPPYKEIFYFRRRSALPVITWLCSSERAIRRKTWRVVSQRLLANAKHTRWFLRYLLLPATDEWYASLFAREQGKIAGDVTPAYARLKREQVARVHTLLPDARVIYLVRNPIERTWSHAAMHFEQWDQRLDSATDEQIMDCLGQGLRDSDYLCTLRLWGSFYPDAQIYVGFFDQLTQDPHGLFLGISFSRPGGIGSVCPRGCGHEAKHTPVSLAARSFCEVFGGSVL